MADIEPDFLLAPLAEQEDDQAQHHADDADQQEPQAEIEDALDQPAVRKTDRILRASPWRKEVQKNAQP